MFSRRLLIALLMFVILGGLGACALVVWRQSNRALRLDASSHWQQALQALDSGDFLLAEKHLHECLLVWPINAEAHFLMARACRQADDDTGWQLHLYRARVLQWAEEQIELERRLMQAQSGNLRGVEESLVADLERSPPGEQECIFEALAKGYLKIDRLADVLALTREWLERFPENWQARLYRGRVFQLGRSSDRAIAEYRRLLELKPDYAPAHFELAGALMLNSEHQQAVEHFEAFLRQYPEDLYALAGLADCQFSLGQFEAAQTTLGKVLPRKDAPAAAFLIQAKLDLALNKPEEAFHWLRRAEPLAPYEVDILYNLILACQRVGKEDEAKQYSSKLQKARKRFDHLDSIKKRILTETGNAGLRYEAGALALSLGRQDEAIHWLESALYLDPGHAPTHRLLADYYAKRGGGARGGGHRQARRWSAGRGPSPESSGPVKNSSDLFGLTTHRSSMENTPPSDLWPSMLNTVPSTE
jgi:tetratricopeptide (TPR) repeat protein